MELNAVIQKTFLTLDGIQITCSLIYEGQEGAGAFILETSLDNIAEMLKIADKPSWEQLPGSPVKLKLEQVDGKLKLIAVGHFLADYWYTIPQNEPAKESE